MCVRVPRSRSRISLSRGTREYRSNNFSTHLAGVKSWLLTSPSEIMRLRTASGQAACVCGAWQLEGHKGIGILLREGETLILLPLYIVTSRSRIDTEVPMQRIVNRKKLRHFLKTVIKSLRAWSVAETTMMSSWYLRYFKIWRSVSLGRNFVSTS